MNKKKYVRPGRFLVYPVVRLPRSEDFPEGEQDEKTLSHNYSLFSSPYRQSILSELLFLPVPRDSQRLGQPMFQQLLHEQIDYENYQSSPSTLIPLCSLNSRHLLQSIRMN